MQWNAQHWLIKYKYYYYWHISCPGFLMSGLCGSHRWSRQLTCFARFPPVYSKPDRPSGLSWTPAKSRHREFRAAWLETSMELHEKLTRDIFWLKGSIDPEASGQQSPASEQPILCNGVATTMVKHPGHIFWISYKKRFIFLYAQHCLHAAHTHSLLFQAMRSTPFVETFKYEKVV